MASNISTQQQKIAVSEVQAVDVTAACVTVTADVVAYDITTELK